MEKYTKEYWTNKGKKIVNEVPKGYVKLEGATTAPKGYSWYSNNKPLFSEKNERKTILVKDKERK